MLPKVIQVLDSRNRSELILDIDLLISSLNLDVTQRRVVTQIIITLYILIILNHNINLVTKYMEFD